MYIGLTDWVHKITSDWNIKTNTTCFAWLLSIEGSREWMVRGTANDRPISYEYLSQFVIFKPLNYCFKETIWFDGKALIFEKRLFNSTGLFMGWKLQTQPIISNPWKVPRNYIAFSQKSFVLSPGLLYHLIRRDSGRLANKVFTSNPIFSLKEYLNGLKITNWTDREAATDQQRYNQNLSREFEKLGRVFEKPGRVFEMLSRVFVLQRGPCCPSQPRSRKTVRFIVIWGKNGTVKIKG